MGVIALPLAERPLLYRLPRETLEALVERIIEYLDATDGDPDLEANGDELDGTQGEDDFADYGIHAGEYFGAGCPCSDPIEYDYRRQRIPQFGIDQTAGAEPLHHSV